MKQRQQLPNQAAKTQRVRPLFRCKNAKVLCLLLKQCIMSIIVAVQLCAFPFRTDDPSNYTARHLYTAAQTTILYLSYTLLESRSSPVATITHCATVPWFIATAQSPMSSFLSKMLRPTVLSNHYAKHHFITLLTPAFGYQLPKTGYTSCPVFPFQPLARPRLSNSASWTS